MLRYLRLYLYFLQFSFSRAAEFRFDFFFRIVMDVVYYAVNIFFFKTIYLHTPLLGGWNENQILVFISGYLIVDAMTMTFLVNNMWWFPVFVNKGELDYYLLRPVSSLFFLTLREVAINSFINLLFVFAIFVYALVNYEGTVTVFGLLTYIFMLLCGFLIYYALRVMVLIPVFWVQSGRGLDQIFWSVSKFMERPDRLYSGWLRVLFTTVLPFAVIASFPARVFLEGFDLGLVLHSLAVVVVFWIATVFLWRLGLRNYSSASS